jgi:acyl carrier protein
MKAIELTKEQKDKLLEMCKALFPELTDLEIRDSMEDFCFKFEHIYIEYGRKNNNLVIIHWFEFCMTHLIEKLFNSFGEDDEEFYNRYINNGASFYGIGVNEIIFVMLSSQKHPVDYLYEEFKKLPIQKDRVKEIVFKDIEIITGITNKELNVEYKLSELGLDSLDEVELIMDLEKSLGIYIPDDDIETKIFKEGNTIQHLVDYVKSRDLYH